MDEPKDLDQLAEALTAEPPRPVDPAALRAADATALSAALRRAVEGLPPADQRRRLGHAFAALSHAAEPASATEATTGPGPATGTAPELAATGTGATGTGATGTAAIPATTPLPGGDATRRRSMPRLRTPARLALAGIAVVLALLAGVGLGAVVDDSDTDAAPVAAPAELPVPLLEPIGTGEEPPLDAIAATLGLPEGDDGTAAARAYAEAAGDQEALAVLDEADPGAPTRVARDEVDRVTGLVDGAGVFGPDGGDAAVARAVSSEPGGDEDPGEGAGDGGGAGDEPAGDAGDADGAAPGDGGDDPDEPRLVDLCAGDAPPPGCEGIAGSIVLAHHAAFAFNDDPELLGAYEAACMAEGELDPARFAIRLETNHMASFTMRYRPAGSTGPWSEATGETPEAWAEDLASGVVLQAVTCLEGDRPEPAVDALEVEVTGVGAEDSGTAVFRGELALPPPVEPAGPEAPEGPTRREGRPDLEVRARNADTLRVGVPLGRNERADVRLVHGGTDDEALDCSVDDPDRVVTATQLPHVAATIPEGSWATRYYDVTSPDLRALLCVTWLDTFEPPRELERAAVPVQFAGRLEVQVAVGAFQPARGDVPRPAAVDVAVLEDGLPCGTVTLTGERLRGEGGIEGLCASLRGRPRYLGLHARARFEGGSSGPAARALMAVPERCAAGTTVCDAWYTTAVEDEDGVVVGSVVIGVFMGGVVTGPEGVVIGEESPAEALEGEPTGPRLHWGRTSARPDPTDPARTVLLDWAADQPASITVEARTLNPTPGCRSVWNSETAKAVEGTLRIEGLCPGTEYLLDVHLADGPVRTSYSALGERHGPGAHLVTRSVPVTTEVLHATFDYELTVRELSRGRTIDEGVVPKRLLLAFPDITPTNRHTYEFSQYYDGRAYFLLDCANPSHYDRRESGIATTLRGGTFSMAEVEYTFAQYVPSQTGIFDGGRGRRCPTFFNQANQTETVSTCTATVRSLTASDQSDHLSRMLAGEPAVLRGYANPCRLDHRRIELTLTVRLREERSLRGTVG